MDSYIKSGLCNGHCVLHFQEEERGADAPVSFPDEETEGPAEGEESEESGELPAAAVILPEPVPPPARSMADSLLALIAVLEEDEELADLLFDTMDTGVGDAEIDEEPTGADEAEVPEPVAILPVPEPELETEATAGSAAETAMLLGLLADLTEGQDDDDSEEGSRKDNDMGHYPHGRNWHGVRGLLGNGVPAIEGIPSHRPPLTGVPALEGRPFVRSVAGRRRYDYDYDEGDGYENSSEGDYDEEETDGDLILALLDILSSPAAGAVVEVRRD